MKVGDWKISLVCAGEKNKNVINSSFSPVIREEASALCSTVGSCGGTAVFRSMVYVIPYGGGTFR